MRERDTTPVHDWPLYFRQALELPPPEKVRDFLSLVKPAQDVHLLDFGCGNGNWGAAFFRDRQDYGIRDLTVDVADMNLDKSQLLDDSWVGKRFHGDFSSAILEPQHYDGIIARHSIMFQDREGFTQSLQKMSDALKPEAPLYFTVPRHGGNARKKQLTCMSTAEIREAVAAAGLELLSIQLDEDKRMGPERLIVPTYDVFCKKAASPAEHVKSPDWQTYFKKRNPPVPGPERTAPFLEHFKGRDEVRLLDFGCGNGCWGAAFYRDKDKHGIGTITVDVSDRHLEVANLLDPAWTGERFHADFIDTPLPEGKYDGIIARNSIMFEDRAGLELSIKRCGEALKPGGTMYFTVPDHGNVAKAMGASTMGREEIEKAIHEAGLTISSLTLDKDATFGPDKKNAPLFHVYASK